MPRKLVPRWKVWRFSASDDGLAWLTPSFLLAISDGMPAINRYVYWWGMSIEWKFNTQREWGGEVFLHQKRWEMKTVDGAVMFMKRLREKYA